MLYTFSQAHYSVAELNHWFAGLTTDDAVVLWQDGVYLPLHHPTLLPLSGIKLFALEPDVHARGLSERYAGLAIEVIDYPALVSVSETYFPQIAL